MPKQRDDGGPAFPRSGEFKAIANNGMSLRDYFAGQVVIAAMADTTMSRELRSARTVEEVAGKLARVCYAVADAMLEESRR